MKNDIDEILKSWSQEYYFENDRSFTITRSDVHDILKYMKIKFQQNDDILQIFKEIFGIKLKSA